MKKLILTLMVLMLAACGSKEIEPVAVVDGPEAFVPVTVSKTQRILVLPFACNILPAEDAATTRLLQNQLGAQLVYMLQSAGVPSEQYPVDMDSFSSSQPASYALLLPTAYAPDGGGMPLPDNVKAADTAATSFEEVTDWNVQVVPPRDTRQFGEAMPSEAIEDAEAIPQPQEIAAQNAYLGERETMLNEAKKRGYDYVLTGTIALVRTEASPTIYISGSERATLRSELNCSFQLVSTEDGTVGRAGSARGRDAKMVVVKENKLNSYHLYSAFDKVMQQAIFNASRSIGEELVGKSLGDVLFRDEISNESSYYQDSPGKRLRQ